MFDAILTSPFFGLALSAAAWCAGLWVQKKTGWVLCNPLIIAGVLIIAILAVFHIPLEHYNQGAGLIQMMLGPVTAVLALNIYHQRATLKEYFLPVLAGCLAGTLASLGSVLALCRLFQLEDVLTASLLPKSVTTAIALGIAESQGGIQGVDGGVEPAAGPNQHVVPEGYRRAVQDHQVVVGVKILPQGDVDPVVAVEIRGDGELRPGFAEEGAQQLHPLLLPLRRQAVGGTAHLRRPAAEGGQLLLTGVIPHPGQHFLVFRHGDASFPKNGRPPGPPSS